MEIRNKRNYKKVVIAVVVIAIIAALVTGAWIITHRNENGNTPKSSDSTVPSESQDNKQTDDSDDDNKGSLSEDDSDKEQSDETAVSDDDPTNGGKTPPRYEGGSVQNSETLTGAINGMSVVGDNLSIRVTINQYINDENGRCDLTLTSPNGATYEYWSDLILNPQTTSCYGWDIPLSDFGGSVSGHWTAQVVVTGDNRTGTFTREVDL